MSVRSQKQRTAPFGEQDYPEDWPNAASIARATAAGVCIRCMHICRVEDRTVLTTHHLNMEKAQLSPWNLAPLCQRCHLSVQARVDFDQPYMGEHKQWMEPFVMAREFCLKFDIDLSAGPTANPPAWQGLMTAIVQLATL